MAEQVRMGSFGGGGVTRLPFFAEGASRRFFMALFTLFMAEGENIRMVI